MSKNTTHNIERGASIDIGTNSVKVWVADVKNEKFPDTVHEEITITKLGEQQSETGRISEDAMVRTLQVAGSFDETARNKGAEQTIIGATSAVRTASNQEEFLKRARNDQGLNIHVLSGDEEARSTFIGVTYDWSNDSNTLSAFDVGGGSTELICGDPAQPDLHLSVPTGSVQLYEELNWSGTLQKDELQKGIDLVCQKLREALSPSERAKLVESTQLIGVGGTVATLAQVDMGASDFVRERIERYRMSSDQLVQTARNIADHPPHERVQKLHIRPGRKEYIVGGMVVVSGLLKALEASEMYCTCRGLRHGLFINEFLL